jgi:hypothetical protein
LLTSSLSSRFLWFGGGPDHVHADPQARADWRQSGRLRTASLLAASSRCRPRRRVAPGWRPAATRRPRSSEPHTVMSRPARPRWRHSLRAGDEPFDATRTHLSRSRSVPVNLRERPRTRNTRGRGEVKIQPTSFHAFETDIGVIMTLYWPSVERPRTPTAIAEGRFQILDDFCRWPRAPARARGFFLAIRKAGRRPVYLDHVAYSFDRLHSALSPYEGLYAALRRGGTRSASACSPATGTTGRRAIR